MVFLAHYPDMCQKLPMLDSNQQIQQSKCWALPLGEWALLRRLQSPQL